jgi:hypothetical protein
MTTFLTFIGSTLYTGIIWVTKNVNSKMVWRFFITSEKENNENLGTLVLPLEHPNVQRNTHDATCNTFCQCLDVTCTDFFLVPEEHHKISYQQGPFLQQTNNNFTLTRRWPSSGSNTGQAGGTLLLIWQYWNGYKICRCNFNMRTLNKSHS